MILLGRALTQPAPCISRHSPCRLPISRS